MERMKLDKFIVSVLCIGMPFHSIFFAVTDLRLFVAWRDILCVFALVVCYVKKSGKVHLSIEGRSIAAAMIIPAIYALFYHPSDVPASIWINTLRIYIGAFVAYYIGSTFSADRSFIRKISTIYIKTALLVSAWGIFQMFVLGEGFLWEIGFGISSAVLANGFQRNVGVFSSANLMGVYVGFSLLMLMYGDSRIKYKKSCCFFLGISLILTFSTSAVLGLIGCIFYEMLRRGRIKCLFKIHMGVVVKAITVLAAILFAKIADFVLVGGKITALAAERIRELVGALVYLDTSRSTSASIHMHDLLRSVIIVKQNFWGVGFSGSTMMLLGRVPRGLIKHAVESSVFTILFDLGVIVGSIYLLPFIYPIIKRFRRKKDRGMVSDKLMIALLILYIFLPLVSSIELRFFAFLFLGFESGRSRCKTGYCDQNDQERTRDDVHGDDRCVG